VLGSPSGDYTQNSRTGEVGIAVAKLIRVKELSVPVERAEEVKKFYRTVASDERSTVVLKARAK
jgi:hypothetical protein